MEDFEENKIHLLKILLKNLLFFLFPKFLELFFTPKNTPPKVWNSKMGLKGIFLAPWIFTASLIEMKSLMEKQYNWIAVVPLWWSNSMATFFLRTLENFEKLILVIWKFYKVLINCLSHNFAVDLSQ